MIRPAALPQACAQLDALQAAGLRHVELAVRPDSAWVAMARELVDRYPGLRLGAASVCDSTALTAVAAARLAYAVSPILDPELLEQARRLGLTLVPGVFTPSEIAQAQRCGVAAVKLFPAASLGPAYWRSLAAPLAARPFCIAAGGLTPEDVAPWLAAGVDAVALGSCLFVDGADTLPDPSTTARLTPALTPLLQRLTHAADPFQLST